MLIVRLSWLWGTELRSLVHDHETRVMTVNSLFGGAKLSMYCDIVYSINVVCGLKYWTQLDLKP